MNSCLHKYIINGQFNQYLRIITIKEMTKNHSKF